MIGGEAVNSGVLSRNAFAINPGLNVHVSHCNGLGNDNLVGFLDVATAGGEVDGPLILRGQKLEGFDAAHAGDPVCRVVLKVREEHIEGSKSKLEVGDGGLFQ